MTTVYKQCQIRSNNNRLSSVGTDPDQQISTWYYRVTVTVPALFVSCFQNVNQIKKFFFQVFLFTETRHLLYVKLLVVKEERGYNDKDHLHL